MTNNSGIQVRASVLVFFCTIFVLTVFQQPCLALAEQHFAQGKDTKPADPNFQPTRATFNCEGLDTIDLTGVLADNIIYELAKVDSTTNEPNLLTGYSCRPWTENGQEKIYQLIITEEMNLWAGINDFGQYDLDIFLLDECDTDACIASGNSEFGLLLSPGEYILIVDESSVSGVTSDGTVYTLEIECRPVGIPVQACENALEIECQVDSYTETAHLHDKDNLVQTYNCSPIIESGGEIWYAIDVHAYHSFTATVQTGISRLDMALWLFEGCGTEAVCIDFSDAATAGDLESIYWENNYQEPVTVYLAVDCTRAPESELLATFTLEVACSVITKAEKKPFGGMKSLYR